MTSYMVADTSLDVIYYTPSLLTTGHLVWIVERRSRLHWAKTEGRRFVDANWGISDGLLGKELGLRRKACHGAANGKIEEGHDG